MYSIDEIMDMLDWHQPDEVQAKGRELASKIRCINVFLQPLHPGHGKNVWHNCAIVLSERSDEELRPYLYELFEWLSDVNWPGAYIILDRLKKYEDRKWFEYVLNDSIWIAKRLKEHMWLETLFEIRDTVTIEGRFPD